MRARIYTTGNRQVERMLRGMQNKDADRISKTCLRAGMGEYRKEIRKAAPVGATKELRASIGARLERNKKTNVVSAKVGINVGKRTKRVIAKRGKVHRAPHGHLVALGTKPRRRKRIGGKFASITNPTDQQLRTGQMTPNKFVSEASARAKPRAHAAMVRKVQLEVRKYNQRRR